MTFDLLTLRPPAFQVVLTSYMEKDMGANLEYQYEIEETIRQYIETRDMNVLKAASHTLLEDIIQSLVRRYIGNKQ